ncbi:MAG: GGDEF domain-containing protein [Anaerolineales bacterium]|nr:GGDEF domain-containing protein [Anaerolineales bacterium]
MKKDVLLRTQIYNEEIFRILMDYEILRTIRYQTPLSLIYLEMTHQVSDGKDAQSTSSIFETALSSRLRAVDIPTRHEKGYLILLPMTNEDGANTVRNRLLTIFEKEFETNNGKSVKFSLQIGLTSHNGGPTLMKEALLEAAKRNLQ